MGEELRRELIEMIDSKLENKLKGRDAEIRSRMDSFDHRMESFDQRMDSFDQKLDKILALLSKKSKLMEKIDSKIEPLDQRVESQQMEKVEANLDSKSTDKIENQFDFMKEKVESDLVKQCEAKSDAKMRDTNPNRSQGWKGDAKNPNCLKEGSREGENRDLGFRVQDWVLESSGLGTNGIFDHPSGVFRSISRGLQGVSGDFQFLGFAKKKSRDSGLFVQDPSQNPGVWGSTAKFDTNEVVSGGSRLVVGGFQAQNRNLGLARHGLRECGFATSEQFGGLLLQGNGSIGLRVVRGSDAGGFCGGSWWFSGEFRTGTVEVQDLWFLNHFLGNNPVLYKFHQVFQVLRLCLQGICNSSKLYNSRIMGFKLVHSTSSFVFDPGGFAHNVYLLSTLDIFSTTSLRASSMSRGGQCYG